MLQSAGRWLGALLEDNKPKNSIAVLDGVRATAIIFVIVYHINRQTGDNLWTQFKYPLLSSISTSGSPGVVFFFSLFLLILITAPQYLQPGHLHELLLFLTFWMDSSSETFRQLNGPYWTLGIEWWFYMFLPFICLGLYVIARHIPLKKRLPVLLCCLVALMIWGLFLRYWGYYLLKHPGVTLLVPRHILDTVMFFLFGQYGKYLEVFALGMAVSLCYIYSRYAPPQSRFSVQIRKSSYWLWGAGILILVFADMWHFVHDY